jgi:hypothetical protein
MALDDSDRIDFLLTRYGQLNQEHSNRNQVIQRTFYLSLIFGIALLGLGIRADSGLETGLLSILGVFIFFSLGLWTRTYVNGRKDTQRQREEIEEELQTFDFGFNELRAETDTFPDEGGRDWWERLIKNQLLYLYYAAVVLLSLFAAWYTAF